MAEFQRIKDSYEILSRVEKRKLYDKGFIGADGKMASAAVVAAFVVSIVLAIIFFVGISILSEMYLWHVLVANFVVGLIIGTARVRPAFKTIFLSALLCIWANQNWSESVDLRAQPSLDKRTFVEVVGPPRATARVTVAQSNTQVCEMGPIQLSGLWDAQSVNVLLKDLNAPWEACATFQRSPLNIFRTRKCIQVPVMDLRSSPGIMCGDSER